MKNADIELIKKEISNCWNHHNDGKTLPKDTKKYVDQTLSLLDNGFIRICERKGGVWGWEWQGDEESLRRARTGHDGPERAAPRPSLREERPARACMRHDVVDL